jgi:tetratricopeptide (TPR) repeat protein
MRVLILSVAFVAATTAVLGQSDDAASCSLGDPAKRAPDFQAAIANCTRVIESGKLHGPALAGAYDVRSMAHSATGNDTSALADASKSIEINPLGGWAFSNRGDIHLRAKQYDRAIADFTKAIELDQRPFFLLYMRRSHAYAGAGEYDRAIADVTRVIELNPFPLSTARARGEYEARERIRRAELYLKAGKPVEGLSDLQRALELSPRETNTPDFYNTRAQILEALGRRDEAAADYQHASRLPPRDIEKEDKKQADEDSKKFQDDIQDIVKKFKKRMDERH